jgi:hypothetical protein
MPQGKKKPADPPKPDDKDDDDDDGGGGGDDAPMTRGEIMKLVNSAVSGQLARKLPAAIEAGVAPVLAKLDEFKAPKPEEGKGGEDDKGKPDPATAALTKKLGDLERQLKERDDKLAKEADARRASKIEGELTRVLTELGVDKHRLRGALAVHKAAALVDDASGNVLYKVKRDGYDEDLDPAAALKEWADTDEGKSYLAPVGSLGGAGARPPRPVGPGRKPAPNTAEAKAEKVAAAKNDLLGAVGQLVAGGTIAIE